MLSDIFGETIQRLLFLGGFCLLTIGLFFLVFLMKVKTKRADYFATLQMCQKLLAVIFSIFIWGVFSIHIGLILWLLLFFILRNIVFKTDAKRLQELHQQFHSAENGYPQIQNVSQWKQLFFVPKVATKIDKQFKYHFLDYADSCAPLLMFCILDMVDFSNNPVVYIAEFLIVATAGYVFLGKIVYYLSLNAPVSVFYLSPGLSYIPVIFVGIVYYAVAMIMLSIIVSHNGHIVTM